MEGGDEDVEDHDGAHAGVSGVVDDATWRPVVDLALVRHEEADAGDHLRHHRQDQGDGESHELWGRKDAKSKGKIVRRPGRLAGVCSWCPGVGEEGSWFSKPSSSIFLRT